MVTWTKIYVNDMETSSVSKFCHCCGSSLESGFKFCPHCGEVTVTSDSSNVRDRSRSSTVPSTTASSSASSIAKTSTNSSGINGSKKKPVTLKCFNAFKSGKEKERSSFFVRKKGVKRAKVNDSEVKITIGIMDDVNKIKRGESIPLKVSPTSSPEEILNLAVEKHATFNKRFNRKLKYTLVFKDGREVATVPGTDPEESFTLGKYKEVSGFGYSQITLYLVPFVNKKLNDLHAVIQDSDSDSSSVDNFPNPSLQLTIEEELVSQNIFGISNLPSTIPGSSVMQPSTSASCIMKVECPLCYVSFPINEVEQHADGCSASFGLLTEDGGAYHMPTCDDFGEEISVVDGSATSTLNNCISILKESGVNSEMDSVRVTVRRKVVWEDFRRARNRYYQPNRVLKITFSGEPAVDDGGPKREFFAGIVIVYTTTWLLKVMLEIMFIFLAGRVNCLQ